MKPGRDLDALVAEKVMCIDISEYNEYQRLSKIRENQKEGVLTLELLELTYLREKNRSYFGYAFFPKYSTDIAAAWKVVEHVRKVSRMDCFSLYSPTDESIHWYAIFDRKYHGRGYESVYDGEQGESAPHAICLAALKAMGVDV
jgi:hypothetical protein